jgi:hypothetical protein
MAAPATERWNAIATLVSNIEAQKLELVAAFLEEAFIHGIQFGLLKICQVKYFEVHSIKTASSSTASDRRFKFANIALTAVADKLGLDPLTPEVLAVVREKLMLRFGGSKSHDHSKKEWPVNPSPATWTAAIKAAQKEAARQVWLFACNTLLLQGIEYMTIWLAGHREIEDC